MGEPDLWQVRLGKNGENIPNFFYETLANEQSLLVIGYGILKDITNMSDPQIKDHIDEINKQWRPDENDFLEYTEYKKKLTSFTGTVSRYKTFTLRFKNKLKPNHTVISPFKYIENNVSRIGILTKDFGTLESLFTGDLNAFLDKINKINQSEITLKECQNLPARKIMWITDMFPHANLADVILAQKDTVPKIGTVTELKFEGKLPHGLVKDPKTIPWIS